MVQPSGDSCRAWQLLVRFFFAQREHLPGLDGGLELSPIQCHVLHLLEPGRPLPMGRLAGMLGCHASNVTGLVDRLEARGVVQRRPSADDRRIKVLDLTAEGSRLRAQMLRRMTTGARPISRLTVGQQRTLVKILEVLVDDSSRCETGRMA
ncbi:MAG TPA: MarR family transcriptional regulator [Vicinamibacterales bacterium]|nr:MarR family transcriptional regulator [Vicinamibacterales bacterium]